MPVENARLGFLPYRCNLDGFVVSEANKGAQDCCILSFLYCHLKQMRKTYVRTKSIPTRGSWSRDGCLF